jgi:hypothetical protein
MATDDDPPFKVEQRDRDGNRIERVIGRAENLIVGRVLFSYNVAARCSARLVACQPFKFHRSIFIRRRNRVAKPDPSKEGPVSQGTGLSCFRARTRPPVCNGVSCADRRRS